MAEPRPCKACGMKIEFHEGPNGRAIPLQRVPVIYRIVDDQAVKVELPYDLLVSHFATCPDASKFSRGKAV